MWFRKVTAGAFGHLRDESLTFAEGLNIVYGPNESGKSTWHAALVVALCGRRHGSGRTNVERAFKNRREPWDNSDQWHVTLELVMYDGRVLEIDRDLKVPRTRILDIGMGGRETDDDLMNQGSPDGALWVGLDRTTFPMTASIGQADILSLLALRGRDHKVERDALQDRLARAAAGGPGGTAAGAIERIRKFSTENVGLDRRNSRRPLRLAIDGVKQAEGHLTRTKEHRQTYVDLARKVDRSRREVRDLESRQAALEALLTRDKSEARRDSLLEQAARLERWERRFPDGDPRDQVEVSTADLVIAVSGARNAPESVETDLDELEVLEGRLEELDQQRELAEAFEYLEEAERQADDLRDEVERLREWEMQFSDGDPRDQVEVGTADLVIAVSGARNAPESVETDLDELEVLEGRLEELDQQRELADALERFEEAKVAAEKVEREVKRLEEWAQQFSNVDPRKREGTSFTDLASAVARCNSLPLPGFTDMDPLKILEDRLAKVKESVPKPCPSPGDVQRWIIPLRETPPQEANPNQIAGTKNEKMATKSRRGAWWSPTLAAVIGIIGAAAVWALTSELLYGALTGALVALGAMLLPRGSSGEDLTGSVDVKSQEHRLRERESFDARIAEAHSFLREWELPLDPDAAVAEFYNRERSWSDRSTELQRLKEMIARRERFDDGETTRRAERDKAFGELRSLVSMYGGEAEGDEGHVLGEAASLLNDLQRVARAQQEKIAEWGRFQEALAGRSVEEWGVEAQSKRSKALRAGRIVEELAAKVDEGLLGVEEIQTERTGIVELIFRRRRFDEEEARRVLEREEAFGELRRVVVLHGGDGSGDEVELLRVADGLVHRFECLAEERREDIAEWGRFQEALAGRSVEEWIAEAENAREDAEKARQRADSLAATLEVALMEMGEIEGEYGRTAELANRRRRFDEEEARRVLEREKAFGELRRVVVLHGGDGSGDEVELLRVADGLVHRFECLAEERREDIAEWGRFQEALAGRSVEEWRLITAKARTQAEAARQRANELVGGLEEEKHQLDEIPVELGRIERQLRNARCTSQGRG